MEENQFSLGRIRIVVDDEVDMYLNEEQLRYLEATGFTSFEGSLLSTKLDQCKSTTNKLVSAEEHKKDDLLLSSLPDATPVRSFSTNNQFVQFDSPSTVLVNNFALNDIESYNSVNSIEEPVDTIYESGTPVQSCGDEADDSETLKSQYLDLKSTATDTNIEIAEDNLNLSCDEVVAGNYSKHRLHLGKASCCESIPRSAESIVNGSDSQGSSAPDSPPIQSSILSKSLSVVQSAMGSERKSCKSCDAVAISCVNSGTIEEACFSESVSSKGLNIAEIKDTPQKHVTVTRCFTSASALSSDSTAKGLTEAASGTLGNELGHAFGTPPDQQMAAQNTPVIIEQELCPVASSTYFPKFIPDDCINEIAKDPCKQKDLHPVAISDGDLKLPTYKKDNIALTYTSSTFSKPSYDVVSSNGLDPRENFPSSSTRCLKTRNVSLATLGTDRGDKVRITTLSTRVSGEKLSAEAGKNSLNCNYPSTPVSIGEQLCENEIISQKGDNSGNKTLVFTGASLHVSCSSSDVAPEGETVEGLLQSTQGQTIDFDKKIENPVGANPEPFCVTATDDGLFPSPSSNASDILSETFLVEKNRDATINCVSAPKPEECALKFLSKTCDSYPGKEDDKLILETEDYRIDAYEAGLKDRCFLSAPLCLQRLNSPVMNQVGVKGVNHSGDSSKTRKCSVTATNSIVDLNEAIISPEFFENIADTSCFQPSCDNALNESFPNFLIKSEGLDSVKLKVCDAGAAHGDSPTLNSSRKPLQTIQLRTTDGQQPLVEANITETANFATLTPRGSSSVQAFDSKLSKAKLSARNRQMCERSLKLFNRRVGTFNIDKLRTPNVKKAQSIVKRYINGCDPTFTRTKTSRPSRKPVSSPELSGVSPLHKLVMASGSLRKSRMLTPFSTPANCSRANAILSSRKKVEITNSPKRGVALTCRSNKSRSPARVLYQSARVFGTPIASPEIVASPEPLITIHKHIPKNPLYGPQFRINESVYDTFEAKLSGSIN